VTREESLRKVQTLTQGEQVARRDLRSGRTGSK
jgi:hypothetical protein